MVLLFSDLRALKSEWASALQPLERQPIGLCKTSSRTTGQRGKAGIETQQRCRIRGNFESVIRKIGPAARYLARTAKSIHVNAVRARARRRLDQVARHDRGRAPQSKR